MSARIALTVAFCATACARPAAAPAPLSPAGQAAIWNDDDRHPFAHVPEDNGPGMFWDGFDQTILRPTTRFLAVDVGGEAANVNALDEVPSSSWFTNRIGIHPLELEELAAGPCTTPALDVTAPITITGVKRGGATPGFYVKGTNGARYLMKFDDVEQYPRPTAADVIGSKIYYAAGFTTPCNRVVFFDRSRLRVSDEAKTTTWRGTKKPVVEADIDLVLSHGARLRDGRYRATVSEWLEGKPIGPWRYHGVRKEDPNDLVPHEDRRELRGSRLVAAWLGHSDARAQNTLDVWMSAGAGKGWIRHDIVDFSDCFGTVWEPVAMGRRFGRSHWFDVGDIAADFFSLGAIDRPWEHDRLGPTGKVFGYFDVDSFDPERWVMEYPNPAFSRMTERDGAWAARVIAQFTDEHLRRVIRTGRLGDPRLEGELLRVLIGRRDRIVRRYLLGRITPFALPAIDDSGAVCARDLAGAAPYRATIDGRPAAVRVEGDRACVEVARPATVSLATAGRAGPLVVTVTATSGRLAVTRVERPYGE